MNNDLAVPRDLEQFFVAASALRRVRAYRMFDGVSFAQLVHYLELSKLPNRDKIEKALCSDLDLRRTFNTLVKRKTLSVLPSEARADDGSAARQRVGTDFSVLFRPSKGNPNHEFVILRVSSGISASVGTALALLIQSERIVARVVFPELQDGKSQIILSRDDSGLQALKQSANNIVLMSTL